MSACGCVGLQPLTSVEADDAMRRWLMRGGFASYATNGKLTLTTTGDAALDLLAQRLVLTGYGTRLRYGIQLNAIGLALWLVSHL